MREYAKKEKQEKKNRYSLFLLLHMFPLSRARIFATKGERDRESTMKVVNAHKRKKKKKKRAKEICIYLCYCLHVDRVSLLLSLVPSIDIQCRKFLRSVFQLLSVLVDGDDHHDY
jgi:hypothetical protein